MISHLRRFGITPCTRLVNVIAGRQKAENVAYLRQKCEQYRRKIIEYKALLDASGYTPEARNVHLAAAAASAR